MCVFVFVFVVLLSACLEHVPCLPKERIFLDSEQYVT